VLDAAGAGASVVDALVDAPADSLVAVSSELPHAATLAGSARATSTTAARFNRPAPIVLSS
jgi:hypothetical protein